MLLRQLPVHLLVWSLLCSLAAMPSWVLADEFSPRGKALGILAWVILYALVTATEAFNRRWEIRYERRAILITYGIRCAIGPLSLVIPAVMTPDLFAGLISIYLVQGAVGSRDQGLVMTFAITLFQGGLLSIATFLLLQLIRLICRKSMGSGTPEPRGFEILPAEPGPSSPSVLPVETDRPGT